MAAGNTYPAAMEQGDHSVRIEGFLEFTDSGNQPAPSGSTADIVAQTVQGADSSDAAAAALTVRGGNVLSGTGSGGNLTLTGGTGGGTYDGGEVDITGGQGGPSAGANGGAVAVTGGSAASGTNGSGSGVFIAPGAKDGSGTDGFVQLLTATENDIVVQVGPGTGTLGFLGATPVVQQQITGALSTVTDAAAKAVLTSIIDALVGYGLATDGTT